MIATRDICIVQVPVNREAQSSRLSCICTRILMYIYKYTIRVTKNKKNCGMNSEQHTRGIDIHYTRIYAVCVIYAGGIYRTSRTWETRLRYFAHSMVEKRPFTTRNHLASRAAHGDPHLPRTWERSRCAHIYTMAAREGNPWGAMLGISGA
jgi:hypothetical protein